MRHRGCVSLSLCRGPACGEGEAGAARPGSPASAVTAWRFGPAPPRQPRTQPRAPLKRSEGRIRGLTWPPFSRGQGQLRSGAAAPGPVPPPLELRRWQLLRSVMVPPCLVCPLVGAGSPVCTGELRRWAHGHYTLVHDTQATEFALDLLFFCGCEGEWRRGLPHVAYRVCPDVPLPCPAERGSVAVTATGREGTWPWAQRWPCPLEPGGGAGAGGVVAAAGAPALGRAQGGWPEPPTECSSSPLSPAE